MPVNMRLAQRTGGGYTQRPARGLGWRAHHEGLADVELHEQDLALQAQHVPALAHLWSKRQSISAAGRKQQLPGRGQCRNVDCLMGCVSDGLRVTHGTAPQPAARGERRQTQRLYSQRCRAWMPLRSSRSGSTQLWSHSTSAVLYLRQARNALPDQAAGPATGDWTAYT